MAESLNEPSGFSYVHCWNCSEGPCASIVQGIAEMPALLADTEAELVKSGVQNIDQAADKIRSILSDPKRLATGARLVQVNLGCVWDHTKIVSILEEATTYYTEHPSF